MEVFYPRWCKTLQQRERYQQMAIALGERFVADMKNEEDRIRRG